MIKSRARNNTTGQVNATVWWNESIAVNDTFGWNPQPVHTTSNWEYCKGGSRVTNNAGAWCPTFPGRSWVSLDLGKAKADKNRTHGEPPIGVRLVCRGAMGFMHNRNETPRTSSGNESFLEEGENYGRKSGLTRTRAGAGVVFDDSSEENDDEDPIGAEISLLEDGKISKFSTVLSDASAARLGHRRMNEDPVPEGPFPHEQAETEKLSARQCVTGVSILYSSKKNADPNFPRSGKWAMMPEIRMPPEIIWGRYIDLVFPFPLPEAEKLLIRPTGWQSYPALKVGVLFKKPNKVLEQQYTAHLKRRAERGATFIRPAKGPWAPSPKMHWINPQKIAQTGPYRIVKKGTTGDYLSWERFFDC